MSEQARSGPVTEPGLPSHFGALGDHPTAPPALLKDRADPRTNIVIKIVLRSGLVLALVLLLAGLLTQLATGHDQAIPVRMFDLFAPRSTGERIMAIGVLLLTLTPAACVVSVALSWALERDLRYTVVGSVVIAVLCTSVLVGLG